MPKMTKTDEALEVTLSGLQGAEFPMALAQIKTIPGRRYDGDRKVWCLPLDPEVAERVIVTLKPDTDAALLGWIKSSKAEKQKELVTPLPEDAEVFVPWRDKLYPYQRALVDWAAKHPKLLLADDMGLGKTFQALSSVVEYQIRTSGDVGGAGPKLIVCPNSVKGVWAREIKKWLGDDEPYVVLGGSYSARKPTPDEAAKLNLTVDGEGDLPRLTPVQVRSLIIMDAIADNAWVIVNWEQLRVKKEEVIEKGRKRTVEVIKEPLFQDTKWVAVIADEAHRAKSRKSQQTKGLFKIDADMKLALTGTPLQNSPDELWPILRWLFPKEYTSYWRFFDNYVDYYEGQYGKIITGVKNTDALRFELATRLVRRTKDEVLTELPDKTREMISIPLGSKQRKLYEKAEKEMWFEVEQAIKAGDKAAARFAEAAADGDYSTTYTVPNGAARTVRLRQVASTPALLGGEDDSAKLDAAVEIIVDAQPKQFVVFSEFVQTCEILAERLRAKGLNAATFTGKLSPEGRTEAEDGFQDGEIDVLIGTIAAMGEGVTLTSADTAIFIERHWTPARNEQAEDRLHRNGQKNAVTVLILEAEDTVDTGKVGPKNLVKSMIVSSIIKKDNVKEVTA